MELLILAALAAGAWWLWRDFRRNKGGGQPQYARIGGGGGGYDLEVVGESHYQQALRKVAGSGEVRHECEAELVMEDDNAYDDQAVAVRIEGRKVGHLSRADARAYRKQVPAGIVGRCGAVIIGGGKGRSLGVWLDLPSD